jgi:beta-carotene 3-hydroxylase
MLINVDGFINIAVWLAVGAAVACAMEPWAALLHGRVWHRLLWRIHGSHHRDRLGRLEANDALSILHAPPAIALILYGCVGPAGLVREMAFGAGLGMTAFGVAYVLVHDGLVHGRLPVGPLARSRWLDRIRRAHLAHHRREHGGPYGLFLGPAELAREAAARRRARAPQRSAAPGPSVESTSR